MPNNKEKLIEELLATRGSPILIGSEFKEIEKAYENEESSKVVSIPSHLNPLLSEASMQHYLWEILENIGTTRGEVEVNGRTIDLISDINGYQIGIEVKEDVNSLGTRATEQLRDYVVSGYFDFLFVSSWAWKKDAEYSPAISSYAPDAGVLTLSPFGQVFINRKPKFLGRNKRTRSGIKNEAKVTHVVWKWFRKRGYLVSAESKLSKEYKPKMGYSYFGRGSFYIKNQPHIPKIDIAAVKPEDMKNIIRSEIIGVEVKTSQGVKNSKKLAEQLRIYKNSRNLTKLYLALPSTTIQSIDVERLLNENNLGEVGILSVDLESENLKIEKNADNLKFVSLPYSSIFVSNGEIKAEDHSKEPSGGVKLYPGIDF